MAKTLREFLEARANDDLRALRALQGASESFCEGTKLATAHIMHKDGRRPEVTAPHQAINNAIQVAICGAGEAAKKVERTRPELKAAYPDYPWIALKRLRDACAHPTRHYLEGNSADSVQLYWKALDDYYAQTPPSQRFSTTDEPLLREIGGGWNVAIALRQLKAAFETEEVNITNNPTLDHIKQYQPNIVENLAGIVAHYNQRHCLMGIGDAIEYTSVFFREAQSLPIDPKPILTVRNRAAHFVDLPIIQESERTQMFGKKC